MTEKQAGLTAMAMAYGRAYHATHDSPKIFDDFLARDLFTPEEFEQTSQNLANMLQYIDPALAVANPDPVDSLAWVMRLTNGPITLGRSRYAEDSLEEALQDGVRQYVILGAGFDTFPYRRRDLADRLQIFALDHPATQAMMRERAAAAGWGHPENLHYVPIDFTRETLKDALSRAPYNPQQRTFFSWLGVSYYLEKEVIFGTLESIAANALRGSQIVFDYLDADAFIPEKTARRVQLMQYMAMQMGEPMKSGFEPSSLAANLAPLGLRLEENLEPDTIEHRYFRDSNGYHAIEHFHYAKVIID